MTAGRRSESEDCTAAKPTLSNRGNGASITACSTRARIWRLKPWHFTTRPREHVNGASSRDQYFAVPKNFQPVESFTKTNSVGASRNTS